MHRAVVAAVLILPAAVPWIVFNRRAAEQTNTLRTCSLTGNAGTEYVGGWSPDGRSLAYTRDTDTAGIDVMEGAF